MDSRCYRITGDTFLLDEPPLGFQLSRWNGQTLRMGFTQDDDGSAYLGGFYPSEPWGAWSRTAEPWVLIPYELHGVIDLQISACGYGANRNRLMDVELGGQKKAILLQDFRHIIHVRFELHGPASILKFSGLDLHPVNNADDPRSLGMGLASVQISHALLPAWEGETLHLSFRETDEQQANLEGFYPPEAWGAWSQTQSPQVLLPCRLSGDVQLVIAARGYAANNDRDIMLELGQEKKVIRLKDFSQPVEVDFTLLRPASLLIFSGLDLTPNALAEDRRTMGIGLQSIRITGRPSVADQEEPVNAKPGIKNVSLDGVIYTSVFNPGDDRANWTDMIRGFCYAFSNTPQATLVLKMMHPSIASFLGTLHILMQQMWPFQCRVVALHGYLDDAEYAKLIVATHYYVNTSRCEGLCLPLMEFMSCGKPSIAPSHTSLADYVDASSTFIVESGIEPAIWPHDPRHVFRTLKYRLDWASLADAYRKSYEIIQNRPDVYRAMADAAATKMKNYASIRVASEQLQNFLCPSEKAA